MFNDLDAIVDFWILHMVAYDLIDYWIIDDSKVSLCHPPPKWKDSTNNLKHMK